MKRDKRVYDPDFIKNNMSIIYQHLSTEEINEKII